MNQQLQFPSSPVSKFLMLTSTSCQNIFPQNLPNNFRNRLTNPIVQQINGSKSNLEIGLAELHYTPTKRASKPVFKKPGDNIITVTERLESAIFLNKIAGRLFTFITYCNLELKKFRPEVEFLIYSDGKTTKIELNNYLIGYTVRLTKSYATAFGFDQIEFGNGKHIGPLKYNQLLFDLIDVATPFKIDFFKDTKIDVTVAEPTEPDVSYLISEINKALQSYKLTFVYDGENLEFESKAPGTSCVLSSRLNAIFGITDGTIFEGANMVRPSISDIDLNGTSEYTIVICSAALPQYMNGGMQQFIHMEPKAVSSEIAHVKSNPIFYYPLTDQITINEIQIRLCDESLELVPTHADSTTIVLLHIRSCPS